MVRGIRISRSGTTGRTASVVSEHWPAQICPSCEQPWALPRKNGPPPPPRALCPDCQALASDARRKEPKNVSANAVSAVPLTTASEHRCYGRPLSDRGIIRQLPEGPRREVHSLCQVCGRTLVTYEPVSQPLQVPRPRAPYSLIGASRKGARSLSRPSNLRSVPVRPRWADLVSRLESLQPGDEAEVPCGRLSLKQMRKDLAHAAGALRMSLTWIAIEQPGIARFRVVARSKKRQSPAYPPASKTTNKKPRTQRVTTVGPQSPRPSRKERRGEFDDDEESSVSVRAVSGGLPSLGKRR